MWINQQHQALEDAYHAIDEYARDLQIQGWARQHEPLRRLIEALAYGMAYFVRLAHPDEIEEIEILQRQLRPLLLPDEVGDQPSTDDDVIESHLPTPHNRRSKPPTPIKGGPKSTSPRGRPGKPDRR